jgi:transcriptional regulator with XRE-family HTH domain
MTISNEGNSQDHIDQLLQDLTVRSELALFSISESMAALIRRRREELGYSQAQLAVLLKTHQSQISRLEDPLYTRHSLLTIAKVADVLQLDLISPLKPKLECVSKLVEYRTELNGLSVKAPCSDVADAASESIPRI